MSERRGTRYLGDTTHGQGWEWTPGLPSQTGAYHDSDDGRPGHDDLDEEPWRYRCPECDGTGSTIRKRFKRVGTKGSYTENQDAKAYHDHTPLSKIADYYCDKCQTPIDCPIDLADE